MSEILPIAFGSLNEGDDPKALPPGTLLVAENCAMDKSRRLVKRYGTTSIVKTLLAGGSIAAGKRLLLRDSDIAISDGTEAHAYIGPLASWKPLGRPPVWEATKRPIADSTRSVQMLDIVIVGDLLFSCYATGRTYLDTAYWQVENLVTGEQVLAPTKLALVPTNGIRLLANATHVFAIGASVADISCVKINVTTLVASSVSVLASATAVSNGLFDAVLGTSSAGAVVYVAFELASGASRTTVKSFLQSTLAADQSVAFTGTGVVTIGLSAGASGVYLAYSVTTGPLTNIVSMTKDLATTAGPTSVGAFQAHSVFVDEVDANNYLVGYVRSDGTGANLSAPYMVTSKYLTASNAIDATTTRKTFGVFRANKPWSTNSRRYVAVTAQTSPYVAASANAFPQPSVVVLEIEIADTLTGTQDFTHPVAAILENQTGWYPVPRLACKAETDADGNVWLPAPARGREPASRGEILPTQWSVYRLTTSAVDLRRSAQVGHGSLLSGAAPLWYDGASLHPYGFVSAPIVLSATAAAGGAVVAGTYSYVATFMWRDANGVMHRSPPSPPTTGMTSGGNLTLNVVISTSCISSKQLTTNVLASEPNPIFIEIWRTTIGGTGPHYRLSMEPVYNEKFNDLSVGDITFADTRADADITGAAAPAITLASRAQLYTDTGELADVPPPAFVTVLTHRGRLVGIGPDLRTVWFSKDSTQDMTIAPGFNEALTLAFASNKSALASLDEKLVVFGEKTIDLVHGDGPDATGQNGSWQIQGVQTDVGCVNPRSVVTSPDGVMFETVRGIEMLGRGLEITWPGEAVTDTLSAYPVITSAVLVPSESEVRFTCNNEDGDEGIVLAWSYLHKTWFTRKYNDAATGGGSTSVAFVDAALIDDVYTMLTAGGQVYQETTAHKLDDGTDWVNRDIVLAPISPGGNLAWHRVKDVSILGTSVTNHDLEVSFARNYATSYEQTKTYLAGSTVTTVGPLEKCRIGVDNQKCQAIKIRIRDLTPTTPGTYPVSTGDGPILEALALRVSVRPGVAKTAASQQG